MSEVITSLKVWLMELNVGIASSHSEAKFQAVSLACPAHSWTDSHDKLSTGQLNLLLGKLAFQ